MSLVSFSDNVGQIILYQSYQLQGHYISKFEIYNANRTTSIEKTRTDIKIETRFTGDVFCGKGLLAENVQNVQFLLIQ